LIDDISTLEKELVGSRKGELDGQQMQRFIACDLGFHALLVRMSSNARILKLVQETRLLIRIFAIHRRGHDAEMLRKIHTQHSEMLRAVIDRNPKRAMQLLSTHIQTSLQERLEDFDIWEHEAALRSSFPVFFDVHPASE
jgi:DNA-binding GntR family transcriptional regulator